MNETFNRLLNAARDLHGVKGPSDLARRLNVSPQVLNGWKKRGVSREGLLDAQAKLGISASWVAYGIKPISMKELNILMAKKGVLETIDLMKSTETESLFVAEKSVEHEEKTAANIKVPLLFASASMGSGDQFNYDGDQIIDSLPISRSWIFENIKCHPENLRIITGSGDSMSPTFSHGDLLLIDISKKHVDIDGVYALSAHQRLFIKRVRQRISGEFEVSSDNPSVKTVDVLNGGHEVVVHGRVVWAWNGRRI